jgi:hypothetical protein
MEKATLVMINDSHNFNVVLEYKYVTDNIRQALANQIDNPFYPPEYLEYHLSKQKPFVVDTVGIPQDFIEKRLSKNHTSFRTLTREELDWDTRLSKFRYYTQLGEEWGGLSAEDAYWERKRRVIYDKGYLPINFIAEYAHKNNDELLIEHLKQFKQKHPDYPLKYF